MLSFFNYLIQVYSFFWISHSWINLPKSDLVWVFLQDYKSVITLHAETIDEKPCTLVVKSYVVNIPDGNTKEDTELFIEALVKCNLKSLANVCERLAVRA